MLTTFEAFRKSIQSQKAIRCNVCKARVKKCKDSKTNYALRCPKCGRDYDPNQDALKTDKDGNLVENVRKLEFGKKKE